MNDKWPYHGGNCTECGVPEGTPAAQHKDRNCQSGLELDASRARIAQLEVQLAEANARADAERATLDALCDTPASAVLLKERDAAIARAEKAEERVQSLESERWTKNEAFVALSKALDEARAERDLRIPVDKVKEWSAEYIKKAVADSEAGAAAAGKGKKR